MSKIVSLDNAYYDYYKLMMNYNNKYEKEKDKIIGNNSLSRKEKREKIKELKNKRVCVNCKREGGTIFTNEQGILKAVCGSKSQPCGLHIEINKGKVRSLDNVLNSTLENVNKLKEKIIKLKLNFLFEYIQENSMKTEFYEVRKNLEKELEVYEKLFNKNIEINENPEGEIEVKRLQAELYGLITENKQLLAEFNETGEISKIKAIIESTINDLQPIGEKIRKTLYKVNHVEIDEKNGVGHLIQKRARIQNNEVNISTPQVVVFTL